MSAGLDLSAATDAELNAAFAEHVAHQPPRIVAIATNDRGASAAMIESRGEVARITRQDVEDFCRRHPQYQVSEWKQYPDYLHSADAVLPFAGSDYDIRVRNGQVQFTFYRPSEQHDGFAKEVARAAVLALLRAHGDTEKAP